MKVKEIVKITAGKLLSGDRGAEITPSRISTDTRNIGRGDFFLALKGVNCDGNDFVGEAFRKGAAGAIVSRAPAPQPGSKKIIIQVKDTTEALQKIAAYHRDSFDIPVICVTGSNGKTTAKDMISDILSVKYKVLKNEGTKNNHIGVPQTLLKLKKDHEACVLELGTNHEGEIRLLANLARPDIAVITNIGPSHLEFFGGLEGVYRAKIEILGALKGNGLLILNGDDDFLSRIRDKRFRVVKYGFRDSNDFKAQALPPRKNRLIFAVNDRHVYELNLFGMHNIHNALAAIAVAEHFGIGYRLIREALFNFKPTLSRLNFKSINGIDIIDDSYNSNPMSMVRALEVIKHYPAGSRWIVSGDMLELGKEAELFHRRVGESIAGSGIEGLLAMGELSKHTLDEARACGMRKDRLWHCATHEEAARILKKVAKDGDVVLLKGSRSMKMEKVLDRLKE